MSRNYKRKLFHNSCPVFCKQGFTLIELLIVIAIIGFLVVFSIVSSVVIKAKARDTERLADAKRLATLIEVARVDYDGVSIETCTAKHAIVQTCSGPSFISQFSRFSDPLGPDIVDACTDSSTESCQYSISTENGASGAKTNDYQICFYLEQGTGDFSSGLHSIVTGSTIHSGCVSQ